MNIKVGKYIIKSDSYCMWIEEEYVGKTKSGEEKTATRQVSGYVRDFSQLLENFMEHKIRNSEAETVTELLRDFAKCEGEIRGLIKGVKKK